MNARFSNRSKNINKSFIREILKVTADPKIISFAGGLPSPLSFPVQEIKEATQKVMTEDGQNALQYNTTEGYLPLREYISDRYMKRQGLKVAPDEILITNGSQQGIDLIGKIFLNKDDDLIIEKPGYLGAIQAFSLYEPTFHAVDIHNDGVDVEILEHTLKAYNPKLFYAVPNFQNPTGITYSAKNRKDVAALLMNSETLFIEDDPYGELRFMGYDMPSMKTYLRGDTILLGSFSKIISPGMRMGWICAKREIMGKLIVAKQATDLHSNYLSQRIICQYLKDNDIDRHIQKTRKLYKSQRDCMVSMIEKYFPKEIKTTRPEGGMFLWAELPKGQSAIELFDLASKQNVAFVPGDPFYINRKGTNTMRLNYTNSTNEIIEEGIMRLSLVMKDLLR